MDINKLKHKIIEILKALNRNLQINYEKFKEYIKPKLVVKNILIAILILISLVGVGAFSYGRYVSSKSIFINKFEAALLGDDPYSAIKYMKLKGKGQLDKNSGKAFIEFVKENNERGKSFVNSMRYGSDGGNDIIRLKENKRFIFKSYYIEIKDVYVTLSTNLKDTQIFLNGQEFYKVKDNDFVQRFGPLVPGIYEIKGIYKGSYGEIENTVKVNIISKEENVKIPLNGTYLTLDGNYRDSRVYLDGKDAEKNISDFKDIGPIPSTSKVYASKKFPWSDVEVKSEEKEILDHSKLILNIDPLTNEVKASLESIYNEFYKGFYEALSKDDKSYIKNTTENIKNSLYGAYEKKSFIVSNSYSLDGVKWQKNAISIENKDGSFKSRAIADIRYKEKTSFLLFNINEKEVKKSFDTELTYDEKQNKWVVTGVKEITIK